MNIEFSENLKFRPLISESWDARDSDKTSPTVQTQRNRIKLQEQASSNLILNYLYSNIKKNPSSFKIGIYTVFIVISFLMLFANITHLAPVLLLDFTEIQTGSADLLVNTRGLVSNKNSDKEGGSSILPYSLKLIKNKEVIPKILANEQINGIIPRWYLIGSGFNPQILSYMAQTFVLLTNIRQENEFSYHGEKHLQDLQNNEIYISETLTKLLEIPLQPGHNITVQLDLLKTLLMGGLFQQQSKNSGLNEEERLFTEDTSSNIKVQISNILEKWIINNMKNNTITSQNLRDIIQTQNFSVIFQETFAEQMQKLTKEYNLTQYLSYNKFKNQSKEEIQQLLLLNLMNQLIQANWSINLTKFSNLIVPKLLDLLQTNLTFKIKDSLKNSGGIWPQQIGNAVIINSKNFFGIFSKQATKQLKKFFQLLAVDIPQILQVDNLNNLNLMNNIPLMTNLLKIQVLNYLSKINPLEYSTSLNVYLKDRINFYRNTDQIEQKLISLSNNITKQIGHDYPVTMEALLGKAYKAVSIFQIFLENLLIVVVVLITVLSCLVIHALMLSNVDEKTYEFGMLRSLGLYKSNLYKIIMAEAFSFSIPGVLIGFIMSIIFYNIFVFLLSRVLYLVLDYDTSIYAILLGLIIGILGPIFSIVDPVQRALSKTLRDSLDVFRKNITDIRINVIKLEKLGISSTLGACSILFVFGGYITYYQIPYFFIFQKMKELLLILNIILLLLVIGVTLLLHRLQGLFASGILHIILYVFKRDNGIKSIALKLQNSHKTRNHRVAFIFSLTVGFLLLGGSTFYNQRQQLEYTIKQGIGSDLVIYSFTTLGLKEKQIRNYLNSYKEQNPNIIQEFSFTTKEIVDMPFIDDKFFFSQICGFPKRKVSFVGVEPNYLNSTYNELYKPIQTKKEFVTSKLQNGENDGVSTLYSGINQHIIRNISVGRDIDPKNVNSLNKVSFAREKIFYKNSTQRLIKLITASGASASMSINAGQNVKIVTKNQQFNGYITELAAKIPGWLYSNYQYIQFVQTFLIKLEDFEFIVNQTWSQNHNQSKSIQIYEKALLQTNFHPIPFGKIFIKYQQYLEAETRQILLNGLKQYIESEKSVIFDTLEIIEGTSKTFSSLRIFYGLIIIVSMMLTLFLLLVSLTKNVNEGKFEIGVLRAIGLSSQQVEKIYLYEAISNIIAGGFIGLFSGGFVSQILILQVVAFTEHNLTMTLPWNEFFCLMILGTGLAVFMPPIALKFVNQASISSILKSQ